MLTLAHSGPPPTPDDIWAAWNLNAVLIGGLLVAVWAYARGRAGGWRRHGDTWHATCFALGLLTIAVALISPLDALSSALASAHMVQHVLLVLVAAPLLAFSAPSTTLLRGTPSGFRRFLGRWRGRLGLTWTNLWGLRHPTIVWLLHVGTLWFWHAAVPYDAALKSEVLHAVEHTSFVVTGLLFWRVVVGGRWAGRVSQGLGLMLVFGMALQSVFLSVLLTFAGTPWYSGYATTTRAWHLEPLADQQLAGVIMWVPAGMIYLGAALALLVAWIQTADREDIAA
jgi:putative membrane protein